MYVHGRTAGPIGQWYARISSSISGGGKEIHDLAAGLAMDIRECRWGLLVSRAAQRLSGRREHQNPRQPSP